MNAEPRKDYICGSDGFKFDNEKPTVELTSEPVSEISCTLLATGNDNHSGVAKYEFYIGNQKYGSYETNSSNYTLSVDIEKMFDGDATWNDRQFNRLNDNPLLGYDITDWAQNRKYNLLTEDGLTLLRVIWQIQAL